MTPLASLLASMPRAGLCFGLRDRPKANGILCPSVAQSLGLPFEVSLGFGGDRAAALASAHRVIDEGQLLIHLGDDAELIAASCTPPTFALSTWESCALTEASCHLLTRRLPALGRALDWYLANLCDGEQLAAQMRGCRASEIVAETASTTDVGSGGLDFVFTSGSDFSGGTWQAQWLGVGPHTTKRELSRAVLEGLSLALATELEVAPPPRDEISQVTVSGRHSKNTAWCDILAHVLGCEVQRTSSSQDAAFGAALLAASFDPSAPTLRALCDAFVHPIRRSSPDAIAHARYADMRIRQQTIRAALAACS